ELGPLDPHGRVAVGGLDLRTHAPERLGDALVRAHRQRGVADQLEPAALPRQDPGEETEDGAGVPAVDRRRRRTQATQPGAVDADVVVAVVLDVDAAGADDFDRGEGVTGAAEAA